MSSRIAVALTIVLGLAFLGALRRFPVQAQDVKFEYKVIGIGSFEKDEEIAKKLNAEAVQGWQLISALPIVSNNVGVATESNPQRILTQARLILRRDRR